MIGMFLATLTVFGLVMVAMALGVMISGKRLQGSCGGLACAGCTKKCDKDDAEDGPAASDTSWPAIRDTGP